MSDGADIVEVPGAYGRMLYAYIGEGRCDRCNEGPRTVLAVDGSEGEYGEVLLCEPCISANLFPSARDP